MQKRHKLNKISEYLIGRYWCLYMQMRGSSILFHGGGGRVSNGHLYLPGGGPRPSFDNFKKIQFPLTPLDPRMMSIFFFKHKCELCYMDTRFESSKLRERICTTFLFYI